MFMPELPDTHYLAIGKFVYQFGNLERWVTWGIIECEDIVDFEKQRALRETSFAKRLRRLESAFQDINKTVVKLGESLMPKFGFEDFKNTRELGNQRNSLLHGEPLTLLELTPGPKGEMRGTAVYVNHNTVHDTSVTLDTPTLDQMTRQAVRLAETLNVIVSNIARNKQREPILIGPTALERCLGTQADSGSKENQGETANPQLGFPSDRTNESGAG
jgi:hypothetical protein